MPHYPTSHDLNQREIKHRRELDERAKKRLAVAAPAASAASKGKDARLVRSYDGLQGILARADLGAPLTPDEWRAFEGAVAGLADLLGVSTTSNTALYEERRFEGKLGGLNG